MAILVTWHSESGDVGEIGTFSRRLSEEQLITLLLETFPDDVVEEDGKFVSYVGFNQTEVSDDLEPIPEETEMNIEWVPGCDYD